MRTYVCALVMVGLAGCGNDLGTSNEACGPVPEAPLRRLSHTEYRNTLRDLFPQLELPELQLAPDPTPHGFDNDAAALQAAPLLVNQYNAAAVTIAAEVARQIDLVVSCLPDEGSACGRELIVSLGTRAFRRPLEEAELATLQTIFDRYLASDGFTVAAELTTQAILQAPPFLYRIETGAADAKGAPIASPYDVASRLSYLLWATMPDQALFDAAGSGELATDDAIAAQVDRMLADPRALDGFMTFTGQWLELARIDRVTKHQDEGWSEDVRAALREEARRFMDEVMFRRGGTLSEFLLSGKAFIGPDTAEFYGLPAPADWTEVDLPPERRGFLMQAQFLSANGHPENPSPVLRGLFVLRNLLCVDLGSPPAGVNMTVPGPEPGAMLTNRMNYDRVTAADLCQSCHHVINPIGFAFEEYDTFGRYRTTDNGLPVDPSGQFIDVSFAGPHELLDYLSTSTQVHQCVTNKYLTYALGGSAAAKDECLARDVLADFELTGGSLTHMMKSIATHPRYLGTGATKEGAK